MSGLPLLFFYFRFPYFTLRKDGIIFSSEKDWEVELHLLEFAVAPYIIWYFSTHKVCLFIPIYLFIQIIGLYQHGLMDSYLILWVIIQYYLFCCSNCSSFGHWLLFLFDILPSLLLFVSLFVFGLFLTFWHSDALGSSGIFTTPPP